MAYADFSVSARLIHTDETSQIKEKHTAELGDEIRPERRSGSSLEGLVLDQRRGKEETAWSTLGGHLY